jgi:hypothetical protein
MARPRKEVSANMNIKLRESDTTMLDTLVLEDDLDRTKIIERLIRQEYARRHPVQVPTKEAA